MSKPKARPAETVDRRGFLRTGAAAVVSAAAAGSIASAAGESPANPEPIATRSFGKTEQELPILGYGGAALIKGAGNPLSTEDRVKLVRYVYNRGVRYFDTAGNYQESQSLLGEGLKGIRDKVYLVTKVETTEPDKVRGAVENSLKELQTDYLDAILIHGTPGIEQMTVERAMEIHGELVKLREEGITKFLGLSAHSYFDKALALISTGGFDQCMLSYGYMPRGYNQVFSPRMLELRNACVAKAHELGMGIAAMKVVGAGVLGAWSQHIVPGFDKRRRQQLPAAAIRWALDDERIQLLVVGMRLKEEIDANIQTMAGDAAYTNDDRALLAEFSAKAFDSDAIKRMKVE
jgi:predicted aldo/keto reductase-like oxidoreductase